MGSSRLWKGSEPIGCRGADNWILPHGNGTSSFGRDEIWEKWQPDESRSPRLQDPKRSRNAGSNSDNSGVERSRGSIRSQRGG